MIVKLIKHVWCKVCNKSLLDGALAHHLISYGKNGVGGKWALAYINEYGFLF